MRAWFTPKVANRFNTLQAARWFTATLVVTVVTAKLLAFNQSKENKTMFQMFIHNNGIEVQVNADTPPNMGGLNAFIDSMGATKQQANTEVVAKPIVKKRGRGRPAGVRNKSKR